MLAGEISHSEPISKECDWQIRQRQKRNPTMSKISHHSIFVSISWREKLSSSEVFVNFSSGFWCSATIGEGGNRLLKGLDRLTIWQTTAPTENEQKVAILVPDQTESTRLSGVRTPLEHLVNVTCMVLGWWSHCTKRPSMARIQNPSSYITVKV